MKQKQLFSAILLLCIWMISPKVQAQLEVGISGGYVRNNLNTSTLYRSFTKYEGQNSFTVGVPVRYNFQDWLAVQAEVSYIRKDYKMSRSYYYEGIYQKTENSYIKLPLMAHFSFGGNKLRGFTNIGGYAAYWANSRVKGVTATLNYNEDISEGDYLQFYEPYFYDEKNPFDSRRDKRIEWGLLAGIGAEYAVNGILKLFIEGRYYYGTTDLQKDYMINKVSRYNDTFTIQMGALLNLSSILGHNK